ncbi:MAG: response regulator [Hasllibacter sp.]
MVVEDEALLALDLLMTLEDEGASVAGPFHRLDRALRAACGRIDGAILDVDLAGTPVFPLADALAQEGVPIVFHTGRADLRELRTRYDEAAIVVKPSLSEDLLQTLSETIAKTGPMPIEVEAAE